MVHRCGKVCVNNVAVVEKKMPKVEEKINEKCLQFTFTVMRLGGLAKENDRDKIKKS